MFVKRGAEQWLPNPVDYPVIQSFGANPANYAAFGLKGHEGWDYACPCGTPVRAAKTGVAGVVSPAYGAYGNCIITHQPDGSGIIYGHLQSFNVGRGQYVNEGDVIAWSNNTGHSSGCHLHFGYQPQYLANLNNGYWGCADPSILFAGANNLPYSDKQYNDLFNLADHLNGYAVDGVFWRFMGRAANAREVNLYKTEPIERCVQDIWDSQERKDRISSYYQFFVGRPANANDLAIRYKQDFPAMLDDLIKYKATH